MKIYDIIAEAPEVTTPSGIVIPAGAKTAAPTPGAPLPANAGPQISRTRRTTRNVKAATTSFYDGLGKAKSGKINRFFGINLTPTSVKIGGKMVPLDQLPGVVKLSFYAAKLLKFLSLMPFVYGYFGKRAILQDMVAQGELDKEDLDHALRMAATEAIANLLSTGAILKFAGVLVKAVSGVRWALTLIQGLVGAGAAAPTGGASAAAAVAGIVMTTAATVAINTWLQSEEGQSMMAQLVMGIIDPSVVAIYNVSFGTVFGKMKELSQAGQAPVQKALSSSPTLAGTLAGKPEVNQAAGQSQGAKPDQLSKEPFDASGTSAGWGTSDPYKDLPSLPNVKIKR
jgi:hypothetical protein